MWFLYHGYFTVISLWLYWQCVACQWFHSDIMFNSLITLCLYYMDWCIQDIALPPYFILINNVNFTAYIPNFALITNELYSGYSYSDKYISMNSWYCFWKIHEQTKPVPTLLFIRCLFVLCKFSWRQGKNVKWTFLGETLMTIQCD